MNTKPDQTVQAEALGLPVSERVRLAYQLLASFDADRLGGSAGLRAAEEHREPRRPASSLSEHGIFLDEGPETGPMVVGAPTEATVVPDSLPAGPMLSSDYADAVVALVERLSPRREAIVPKPPAQAPGDGPDLAPPPLGTGVAVDRPEPDLFADWDQQAAGAFAVSSMPVPVHLGWPRGWSRGVVVTSAAAGVAALLALGLLIQGREPAVAYVADATPAVTAPEEGGTFREIPTIQPSPAMQTAQRATLTSERAPGAIERRGVTDRSGVTERRAVTEQPAVAQRPAVTQRPAAAIQRPAATERAALTPPPSTPAPSATSAISDSRVVANTAIGSAVDSVPAIIAAPPELPLRSVPSQRAEVVPVSTALSSISRLGDDAGPTLPPPAVSPFDVAPVVSNPGRVQQALRLAYPRALQEWGIGGEAEMWFYVNPRGAVDSLQLKRTSGNKQLDKAALRVAESFEFTPGLRGSEPTAGWVSLAIIFNGR